MATQQPDPAFINAAADDDDDVDDVLLVQSVPLQDMHGVRAVMLVGDPSLDVAVVVQRTSGFFCLPCSAQWACWHVKAVSGNTEAVVADVQARESAWAMKFAQVFDTSFGCRRVISISKARPVVCHTL